MTQKRSYNIKALLEALHRDRATLLTTYDKTTKRSTIQFKCNCGQESQKNCLEIISRAGAFCKECTRNKSINKLHQTLGALCTLDTLKSTTERDNAQLLINYDTITKIQKLNLNVIVARIQKKFVIN